MSSSSSCAKPEFPKGAIVSGYEVIKKLGSGGFGAVYHVRKNGLDAALKTEFVMDDRQTLRNEVHMLRLAQWSNSFCRIYCSKRLKFEDQKVNIMVMSLCGRPLSRLRRMMPERRFTKSTATRVSRQILTALRDLHKTGILHRDVKASNCGWHAPSRSILLFDLGFSRKFLEVDPNTKKLKHRTARKSAGFLGTSKYCSLNAHDEMDQGRRDDLWAWLYTTAEFYLGSLPWSNENNTHLMSTKKIKVGSKLFMKCPREIYTIYEHIKALKFESCPDYQKMFRQFDQISSRYEIEVSDPFDFELGSAHYEKYFANKQTDSEKEDTLDESLTDGDDTKADRVVDLDTAPDLNESAEVITLNSSGPTSPKSKSSNDRLNYNRLTAGLNRAFNKVFQRPRRWIMNDTNPK